MDNSFKIIDIHHIELLESVLNFLREKNISHGKIEQLSNGLYILAFRDPDNIRLELAWKDNQ